MVNKSTNTEKKGVQLDIPSIRSPSLRLKERNVKHTKILNIRELDNLYVYGERLGKGVFGTVIEITDKQTKQVWALKIVDRKQPTSGTKINNIENELKILRMVNHPHIIHLEKSFESTKNFYLVIERCNADLSTILRQREKFTNDDARKVLNHLTSAVAYLHKHDIVHRDLKMENILTAPNPNDPTDQLYIKVSDFGLGTVKSSKRLDEMLTERCGTIIYMAPEIISRTSYNHQCDVWSMGIICFILLTGTYPFYHSNETDLYILICNYDPIGHTEYQMVPEAKHLLGKMLEKNPALRISAAEANRHPWIQHQEFIANVETDNVLHMMQMWRDDMMVPSETDSTASDWAQAFSSLEAKSEKSLNKINNMRETSVIDAPFKGIIESTSSLVTTSNKSQKTASKSEYDKMKVPPYDQARNNQHNRALNVAGKSTKFMRIGKLKSAVVKTTNR